MPQAAPGRAIGELTFPEIATRLNARSILCLPIGSIEQHGPHLPLNTDVVLAEEFTRRIVARWGDALDLWQLPTLTISLAREHEWAPGTIAGRFWAYGVRDLGAKSPARYRAPRHRQCHGGNRGILEA